MMRMKKFCLMLVSNLGGPSKCYGALVITLPPRHINIFIGQLNIIEEITMMDATLV